MLYNIKLVPTRTHVNYFSIDILYTQGNGCCRMKEARFIMEWKISVKIQSDCYDNGLGLNTSLWTWFKLHRYRQSWRTGSKLVSVLKKKLSLNEFGPKGLPSTASLGQCASRLQLTWVSSCRWSNPSRNNDVMNTLPHKWNNTL